MRRACSRPHVVRRCGRRYPQHREDQLRRPPPPHRTPAGQRHAAPRFVHRLHLVRCRSGLGAAGTGQGISGHARLRLSLGLGDRAQLERYFHSSRQCAVTWPARPSRYSRGASASTPSAPVRRTPHWPKPTPNVAGFGADYREETGIEASTPLEQAYPLVFLCSDAAAAISGITLISDAGYISSGVTGSTSPPRRPRASCWAKLTRRRPALPGPRRPKSHSRRAGVQVTRHSPSWASYESVRARCREHRAVPIDDHDRAGTVAQGSPVEGQGQMPTGGGVGRRSHGRLDRGRRRTQAPANRAASQLTAAGAVLQPMARAKRVAPGTQAPTVILVPAAHQRFSSSDVVDGRTTVSARP